MTDEQPTEPAPIPPVTKEAKRRATLSELQVLLAALIVLALLITPAVVLFRQSANHGVLTGIQKDSDNTQQILDFVLDCTQPTGKCYKQGQQSTADTIGKVEAGVEVIVVLAAACAKEPQNSTVAEITACVQAGLH